MRGRDRGREKVGGRGGTLGGLENSMRQNTCV